MADFGMRIRKQVNAFQSEIRIQHSAIVLDFAAQFPVPLVASSAFARFSTGKPDELYKPVS
jgi:selenocysteine lyase/cysteine desulfurase